MYHCFGMVMGNLGALCHGASIVYPAPSFDASKTLHALLQEKCTSVFAVPTMFTQLVTEHGGAPPIPSLRTGLMAGSSCPEKLMLQVHISTTFHVTRHTSHVTAHCTFAG